MTSQRQVSDFTFDAKLRKNDVIRRWGEGLRHGPSKEMLVYGLPGDEGVWLTFESGDNGHLTRALFFGPDNRNEFTRELFNTLPQTRARKCSDIPLDIELTPAKLFEIWGSPDGEFGSGLQYWSYNLADGSGAAVTFAGERGHVSGCPR